MSMRLNRRLLFGITFFTSFLLICKLVFNYSLVEPTISRGSFKAVNFGRASTEKKQNLEDHSAIDELCWYDDSCSPPQILFRLHAGTATSPPFGCLNDIRLFNEKNVVKGLNFVALNGSTGDIDSSVAFDVSTSDEKLITWLRTLPTSSIVIGVSFGDVAERVSADARAALSSYGAVRVNEWRGGDAYAILGQQGLKTQAYELLISQTDITGHVIEGCFDLPLGDIGFVNMTEEHLGGVQRIDQEQMAALGGFKGIDKTIELGKKWKWCGMETPCKKDEISLHFFSGEHKDDWPKMCVDGRIVFDRGLNGAGRGLNMAAIEPKTKRISAAANFDTYEDETTGVEEWLDSIALGDIVAVVSFDEASTMLSDMAKRIFYEMGSSMIDRLKFRASWYFVGHKGIAAYSPFENLNIPSGNNWAKPIKTSFCLPRSLSEWRGRPNHHPSMVRPRNLPKRHFCAKYDKHEYFCHEDRIDDPIRPRPLVDQKRLGDPIFNTPILIVAGLSTDSLRLSLELLMNQEGLNTQMVIVTYDREYAENAALANLFHVKSIPMNVTNGYNSLLHSSLLAAFSLFPSSSAIAVIEENVQLSPDWLFFLSQTLPILVADSSIDLVHTFNPNGFTDTSGHLSSVYRVDAQPPIFSYLLSRRMFEREFKYSFNQTTSDRWHVSSSSSLVPDVSRILIEPSPLVKESLWMDDFFVRKRIYSRVEHTLLVPDFKTQSFYDASLASLIGLAPVLSLKDIECNQWIPQIKEVAKKANSSAVVISCTNKIHDLDLASHCFGLYFNEKFITGMYKRVIRFVSEELQIFIVPSGSHFEGKKNIHISKLLGNYTVT